VPPYSFTQSFHFVDVNTTVMVRRVLAHIPNVLRPHRAPSMLGLGNAEQASDSQWGSTPLLGHGGPLHSSGTDDSPAVARSWVLLERRHEADRKHVIISDSITSDCTATKASVATLCWRYINLHCYPPSWNEPAWQSGRDTKQQLAALHSW